MVKLWITTRGKVTFKDSCAQVSKIFFSEYLSKNDYMMRVFSMITYIYNFFRLRTNHWMNLIIINGLCLYHIISNICLNIRFNLSLSPFLHDNLKLEPVFLFISLRSIYLKIWYNLVIYVGTILTTLEMCHVSIHDFFLILKKIVTCQISVVPRYRDNGMWQW